MIIAIDPGTVYSAVVVYDGTTIGRHEVVPNTDLREWLSGLGAGDDILVVEWIESYGMVVGREVFETVYWVGRFCEAWRGKFERIPRRKVKLTICQSPKATDANIRRELMDRFGGDASVKKGGALYKVKSHEWAALALAVTYFDTQTGVAPPLRPSTTAEF